MEQRTGGHLKIVPTAENETGNFFFFEYPMRTPNVEIDFGLGDLVGAVPLTARRKPEQKTKTTMPCQAPLEYAMSQLTGLSKTLLGTIQRVQKVSKKPEEQVEYTIIRAQYSVVLKLLKQEVNVITECAELKIEVEDAMEKLDDGTVKSEEGNPLNEGRLLHAYNFMKSAYHINGRLVYLASLMATAKVCKNPTQVKRKVAPYNEQVLKKIEKRAEELRNRALSPENVLHVLNNEENLTVEFEDGFKIRIYGAED